MSKVKKSLVGWVDKRWKADLRLGNILDYAVVFPTFSQYKDEEENRTVRVRITIQEI
jgi:hypothetical protein